MTKSMTKSVTNPMTAPSGDAPGRPDPLTVDGDVELRPAVAVEGVSVRVRTTTILTDVDLTVGAGSLVAIAGGSGAGKTTLLETMAGLRRPSSGGVFLGPERRAAHERAGTGRVGVVPQDDIIHRDLPLGRTLLYAARLRLGTDAAQQADRVVTGVLDQLGLAPVASVLVGSLSGGQRKRASIAVELLTRPEVLFLDEPTSGLDPVSAGEVIESLRALTRRGTTVVMTTHDPTEIASCDTVIFMAPGGRVCFSGSPSDARAYFEVGDLASVYPLVASDARAWADRWSRRQLPAAADPAAPRTSEDPAPHRRRSRGASRRRQWTVLSARGAEVMARNRLTLAILLGSPALVITMMAILFPAGASDSSHGSAAPQVLFWLAFSAFFFGLTYGLLQVVTERAVLRRERYAGLSLVAYLTSKVTLLLPMLVIICGTLLAVLRMLDRVPDMSWSTYGELLSTLSLTSAAGLLIGLAASAAVADATQATLALPMICFPQVLFAGAIVPVNQMAGVGNGLSRLMATRWAFESLGRTLYQGAPTASVQPYQEAFTGPLAAGWIPLIVITAVAAAATMVALHTRTHQAGVVSGGR